jgi:hypothetical protein
MRSDGLALTSSLWPEWIYLGWNVSEASIHVEGVGSKKILAVLQEYLWQVYSLKALCGCYPLVDRNEDILWDIIVFCQQRVQDWHPDNGTLEGFCTFLPKRVH